MGQELEIDHCIEHHGGHKGTRMGRAVQKVFVPAPSCHCLSGSVAVTSYGRSLGLFLSLTHITRRSDRLGQVPQKFSALARYLMHESSAGNWRRRVDLREQWCSVRVSLNCLFSMAVVSQESFRRTAGYAERGCLGALALLPLSASLTSPMLIIPHG